jgi:hypothetical protein
VWKLPFSKHRTGPAAGRKKFKNQLKKKCLHTYYTTIIFLVHVAQANGIFIFASVEARHVLGTQFLDLDTTKFFSSKLHVVCIAEYV